MKRSAWYFWQVRKPITLAAMGIVAAVAFLSTLNVAPAAALNACAGISNAKPGQCDVSLPLASQSMLAQSDSCRRDCNYQRQVCNGLWAGKQGADEGRRGCERDYNACMRGC